MVDDQGSLEHVASSEVSALQPRLGTPPLCPQPTCMPLDDVRRGQSGSGSRVRVMDSKLQSGQAEIWPMSVVAHANSHISRLGAAMGYSVPLVSSLGRMDKEGPCTRRLEVQQL